MPKKKKETGLVVPITSSGVPAYLQKGTGKGNENVGMDDLIIPRLCLIQSMSPERMKTKPEYIEGAEEGMMFNNVTRQLYDETLQFVPVYYRMEYLIFKDREAGGGFRGAFPTRLEAQTALEALEEMESCSIVNTAQHFCLVIIGGELQEIVISMSASKLKISRKLNSLIRIGEGDRFSRVYELVSVPESNDKGDYINFDVKPVGFPNEETYLTALKVYSDITEGSREIDRNYVENSDDEVPF